MSLRPRHQQSIAFSRHRLRRDVDHVHRREVSVCKRVDPVRQLALWPSSRLARSCGLKLKMRSEPSAEPVHSCRSSEMKTQLETGPRWPTKLLTSVGLSCHTYRRHCVAMASASRSSDTCFYPMAALMDRPPASGALQWLLHVQVHCPAALLPVGERLPPAPIARASFHI